MLTLRQARAYAAAYGLSLTFEMDDFGVVWVVFSGAGNNSACTVVGRGFRP